MKNSVTMSRICCHYSDSCISFSADFKRVKGAQITLSVFMKIVFILWAAERVLGASRGPSTNLTFTNTKPSACTGYVNMFTAKTK